MGLTGRPLSLAVSTVATTGEYLSALCGRSIESMAQTNYPRIRPVWIRSRGYVRHYYCASIQQPLHGNER